MTKNHMGLNISFPSESNNGHNTLFSSKAWKRKLGAAMQSGDPEEIKRYEIFLKVWKSWMQRLLLSQLNPSNFDNKHK